MVTLTERLDGLKILGVKEVDLSNNWYKRHPNKTSPFQLGKHGIEIKELFLREDDKKSELENFIAEQEKNIFSLAVQNRDIKKVVTLLEKGWLPIEVIQDTFLYAIENGLVDIAREIIKKDIISSVVMGKALLLANKRGYTNSVMEILKSDKVSPEVLETMLLSAVENNYQDVAEEIMKRDMVSSEAVMGEALIMAARNNYPYIVSTLLKKGKVPQSAIEKVFVYDNFIALAKDKETKIPEIGKMLIETSGGSIRYAFINAVVDGDIGKVRAILERYTLPDKEILYAISRIKGITDDKYTELKEILNDHLVLDKADKNGGVVNVYKIRKMLEGEVSKEDIKAVFLTATTNDRPDLIKMLLADQKVLGLDNIDEIINNSFVFAVKNGSFNVVKEILDNDQCKKNVSRENMEQMFLFAAENGYVDIVKIIQANDTNKISSGVVGRALELAVKDKLVDVAIALLRNSKISTDDVRRVFVFNDFVSAATIKRGVSNEVAKDVDVAMIENIIKNGRVSDKAIQERFVQEIKKRANEEDIKTILGSGRISDGSISDAFLIAIQNKAYGLLNVILDSGKVVGLAIKTAFLTAVAEGDIELIQELFKNEKSLVVIGAEEISAAIIMASQKKNVNIVEFLAKTELVKSKKVDGENIQKAYVSFRRHGDFDAADILQKSGLVSDLTKKNVSAFEEFLLAIKFGDEKQVKDLCDSDYLSNADKQEVFICAATFDSFNYSDMQNVQFSKQEDSAERFGSNIGVMLKSGVISDTTIQAAFLAAVNKNNTEFVKVLLKSDKVLGEDVQEAFLSIMRRGHNFDMAELLLKSSKVHYKTIRDLFVVLTENPMMIDVERVSVLLQSSKLREEFVVNLLLFIAKNKRMLAEDVVTLLLEEHGLSQDVVEMALIQAIESDNNEVGKLLWGESGGLSKETLEKVIGLAIGNIKDRFHSGTIVALMKEEKVSSEIIDKLFRSAIADKDANRVAILLESKKVLRNALQDGFIRSGEDKDSLEITKILLDKVQVADIEAMFTKAIDGGNIDLIRVVLESGKISNSLQQKGFKSAIQKMDVGMIRVLLNSAAVSSHDAISLWQAFISCPKNKKKGLLGILLSSKKIDVSEENIRDAFLDAAKDKEGGLMDMLLNDKKMTGKIVNDVFELVAKDGNIKVAIMLLERGEIATDVLQNVFIEAAADLNTSLMSALLIERTFYPISDITITNAILAAAQTGKDVNKILDMFDKVQHAWLGQEKRMDRRQIKISDKAIGDGIVAVKNVFRNALKNNNVELMQKLHESNLIFASAELIWCIKDGQPVDIKNLLSFAKSKITEDDVLYALEYAAKDGKTDAVKELLRNTMAVKEEFAEAKGDLKKISFLEKILIYVAKVIFPAATKAGMLSLVIGKGLGLSTIMRIGKQFEKIAVDEEKGIYSSQKISGSLSKCNKKTVTSDSQTKIKHKEPEANGLLKSSGDQPTNGLHENDSNLPENRRSISGPGR